MAVYYVNNNAQPTGEHEVHMTGCSYMPTSKTNLGDHATCQSAVRAAKQYYTNVDGCYYCARACHTR
ncbi:MAG: hypothetical protein QM756_16365 [Polyangiaceae bacterium]